MDLICGTYLSIIWAANYYYFNTYITNEHKWQSSMLCFTSFGLAFFFTMLSPIVLFILSLSRLMVVRYPLESNFKRVEFEMYASASVLGVSVVLTITTHQIQEELPIGLCLPFVDPASSSIMFMIITWIVAVNQLFASMTIVIVYILLFKELHKSKPLSNSSSKKDKVSKLLIFQLVLVSASNIICWLPSSGIYLASQFMTRYPTKMIIWTTVMPLNSIINPVLFIAHAVRKPKTS